VETISPAPLDGFVDAVGRERAFVEVGLESANPWVLRNCINKMLDLGDYARGIQTLTDSGIRSATNVSLGTAFLTESEAIADAVGAIRFAHEAGSDLAVLFPLHVRRHTLLHWLWTQGMYSPVSIWSVIDVLMRVGPSISATTTISWYRNRAGEGGPMPGIVASPGTCDRCSDEVLAILDEYRDSGEFGLLERLSTFPCNCRDEWEVRLAHESESLADRMATAYRSLGIELLGIEWWTLNGESVIGSLGFRAHPVPFPRPPA
jgi:radical SAM enzyme (TIGR01210 family)